jgi:hypothetical protein
MHIVTNEALYKRNTRLALIANLTGMFMLVGSVFVLFNSPNQFGQYLLFLLGGAILVQVGTYLGRWNRRPDLALNKALQSLDSTYTIYHSRTPVPHLLIGPSGLWILLPRNTRGTITYDERRKRWRAKSGLLARFGQEAIGNPVREASWEAEALDRFFQKNWKGDQLRVQAAVIFVDENADVQVSSDAALPTAGLKRAKQILLKSDPKARLSRQQIDQLNQLFQK